MVREGKGRPKATACAVRSRATLTRSRSKSRFLHRPCLHLCFLIRASSLAAAQLKRSLENRDKRRQADKIARLSGKDDEQHAALRGPVVNQSVATLGAISEQHEERQTARCDLCQVRQT